MLFREFSLYNRLRFLFSGLMVLAILFSGILLVQQHRIGMLEAKVATNSYDEILIAIQMREVLSEIDHKARMNEVDNLDISAFRTDLSRLSLKVKSPENREDVSHLQAAFEDYFKVIQAPHAFDLKARFENVAAILGTFIEVQKNSVYRVAEDISRDRGNSIKGAISFLMGFIFLVLLGGNKIISIITEPLSDLVRFLDGVQLEDDLPESVPQFESKVYEVSQVAKAFLRLLERLRAYKTINLRRLLFEKKRADIIAASMTDGIFLLRGEEILYMNPKAEKILGLNLTGKDRIRLSGLSKEPCSELAAQALTSAFSRAMPIEIELVIEGRKTAYIVRTYPVYQELVERVEQTVDLKMDSMLDRFQVDTMILAQDVTLVKESQEAKSHFLATLSHEVKTPVTSLTMATHLLRKSIEQFPNPSHRSLINTCVTDVDRLRLLLDQFLTISRLDTLAQNFELKDVNFSNLLKHSIQSFMAQAQQRGVKLISSIHVPARETMLQIDPSKMTWALSNLLTNAIHHTPKGGTVEVTLDIQEFHLEIRVRDTGPGIDENRKGKIFDKFNSFYDIRVARSGGAGVGLSIAKEIIAAHGGNIWVSSRDGQGAEFCFNLPLKQAKPGSERNIHGEVAGS